MTDLDAIEKRAREAKLFPGGLSATKTAALADDVLALVEEARLAREVLEDSKDMLADLNRLDAEASALAHRFRGLGRVAGDDEMSEFNRQVERQVLRTRALCAEDQRDEWRARAEKAESARDIWKSKLDVCLEQGRQVLERAERAERLIAVSRPPATTCQVCACVSSECDATLERLERAEADKLVLDDAIAMLRDRAEHAEARAERAEALLRDSGKMADMGWCDDSDCDCKYQQWRAKVRNLLEGKT